MTTPAIEAPTITSAVRFERLEYGKYCSTPNGPILPGVEHRVLGASPGFPEALKSLCKPPVLGLGTTIDRRWLAGTVLRPVHQDGRTLPVMYRIGQRLESGEDLAENARSRPYLLARYLVDMKVNGSPLAMFRAMQPLAGLTRDQIEQLEPVSPAAQESFDLGSVPEFLRRATLYVVSGVAFQIDAAEEEFFQLVHRLWFVLPNSLRPLLSAGWNVTPPLLGSLSVSRNSISAPHSGPTYLASTREWRGQLASEQEATTLLPGRIYCSHCFNWPELKDDELTAKLSEPESPLPQFPDFSSVATKTFFRKQGMLQQEDSLAARWRGWLQGNGSPELPLPVAPLLEKFAQEKLLDLLSTQMGDCPRERRFRLGWDCLELDPSCFDRAMGKGILSPDLVWLRKLRNSECSSALDAFPSVPPGVEELPQKALERWYAHLDNSLVEPGCLAFHAQRLGQSSHDCYGDWAARNSVCIALALIAGGDKDVQAPLVSGLPEKVRTCVGRVLSLQEPTAEDSECISSLTISESRAFAMLVQRQWLSPGFAQRIVLLKWAKAKVLPLEMISDPWFRLAADGALNPKQIQEMVPIMPSEVPAELKAALAMEALRLCGELREHIEEHPDIWQPLLSLWPDDYHSVLVDVPLLPASAPSHLGNASPYSNFDYLQERLHYWFGGRSQASHWQSIRARSLLRLAASGAGATFDANAIGKQTCAACLCGCIYSGRLPESDVDPSEEQLALASAVLRVAQPLGLDKEIQQLWSTAHKKWQLRLLMEASPQGELVASAQQLESLIGQRQWLRSHLVDPHVNPARKDTFGLAAVDFHSLSYAKKSAQWKGDFCLTALWAAFQDIPVISRGELKQALDFYAGSDLAEAARCCLLHLHAYKDQRALVEVLSAYLLPMLQTIEHGPDGGHRLLGALAKGIKQVSPVRATFGLGGSAAVLVMEPAVRDNIRRLDADRLEVPAWLFPLLWEVVRDPKLPVVLKELAASTDGKNTAASRPRSVMER